MLQQASPLPRGASSLYLLVVVWLRMSIMPDATIYILLCTDGSYYTGITRRDVEARVSEHQQGLDPSCYTFKRRPVRLVHAEAYARICVTYKIAARTVTSFEARFARASG